VRRTIVLKLLELKQRMRSVENIEAITRTLATVSAAKLSWSRRRATGLREYTRKMEEILGHQKAYLEGKSVSIVSLSPLLMERDTVHTVAVLVITADRGMCGNHNLAACRLAMRFWDQRKKTGQNVVFLVKGKKGERYFRKRSAQIIYSAGWRRKGVLPEEVEKLLSLLLEQYLSRAVDEVYAVYTQFYSPIRRLTMIKRMLPITLEFHGRRGGTIDKWYYEPSFREIVDELLAIYLRVQLYDVLLESYSSEQGARMITMKEATERANKTLWECRGQFNRLRRESITLDLLSALYASKVVEEVKSTPGKLA
jgi:F-type H+-transporting ATPase subunit gamma